MSSEYISLAAKYRPQNFAQVAGQDMVKTILSNAAYSGKVAPAYLLSGTRGVGKTTLARIFAKALNCRKAPVYEPCNQCDICKAITIGNALDVVEIDAASNRGIDDVRKLKEVVGYSPMDSKYKVFIIDEAHMLSREAFNAFLKTLEEPPARVVFIMATTEAHKFPATIISRCQHLSFTALTEQELIVHIEKLLGLEGVKFESSAVKLLVRRGAGSARDTISILGQVLAYNNTEITEEVVRKVLGLAGLDAFINLFEFFKEQNIPAISSLVQSFLQQGLDIGFFLRELALFWRNLFILKQSGDKGREVIPGSSTEIDRLCELCDQFSLTHIHAAWQMTLEGQRQILSNPEPSLALELLLINIAMLPELLSMEKISTLAKKGLSPSGTPKGLSSIAKTQKFNDGAITSRSSLGVSSPSASHNLKIDANREPASFNSSKKQQDSDSDEESEPSISSFHSNKANKENLLPEEAVKASEDIFLNNNFDVDNLNDENYIDSLNPKKTLEEAKEDSPYAVYNESNWGGGTSQYLSSYKYEDSPKAFITAPDDLDLADEDSVLDNSFDGIVDEAAINDGKLNVFPEKEDFIAYAESSSNLGWFISMLQRSSIKWEDGALTIKPQDAFLAERFKESSTKEILEQALIVLHGKVVPINIVGNFKDKKKRQDIEKEIKENDLVKLLQENLDARIIDFWPIK